MALLRNKRDEDVLIYPPDGGAVLVEAGGTVEVGTDHGRSLLEQPDNWERVKGKKTDEAGTTGEEG